MGAVGPMMVGSLKLGSAGVVRNFEVAAERWEGLRLSKKSDFGVIVPVLHAREKIDGANAEFGPLGVKRRRPGARLVRCNGESGEGGRVGESKGVIDGMKQLLDSEHKELANQAAQDLVSSLDQEGRATLLSAFYRSSLDEDHEEHFKEADVNLDGIIDQKEFAAYAKAQAIRYGNSSKPLTSQQMFFLFTKAAVGMVGFGFTDNAIMIVAGDAIQNSIGATLGLTTLLSAGLGNAVADLIGTGFRGYIERLSGNLMPQDVPVSANQLQQKEAWWAETVGASCGVTVGCLLGLIPLFLLRRKEDQQGNVDINIDTKFASISSSTTTSSSSFLPSQVSAADAADHGLECREYTAQATSLTSSVRPAVTPALQLRSFHSALWETPVLFLSVVAFMALRRLVNYRKVLELKIRN